MLVVWLWRTCWWDYTSRYRSGVSGVAVGYETRAPIPAVFLFLALAECDRDFFFFWKWLYENNIKFIIGRCDYWAGRFWIFILYFPYLPCSVFTINSSSNLRVALSSGSRGKQHANKSFSVYTGKGYFYILISQSYK